MSHYFINDKNLANKPNIIEVKIRDHLFSFRTDSGVFSKDHIDFGSKLLAETFLDYYESGSILDLGCGYGFIGITLSKILQEQVDMIDINEKAINLSIANNELNNTKGNVFLSDGFNAIVKQYGYIVSNPPIRIGKKAMYELLINAKNYLQSKGELWLVVRKAQGAESLVRDLSKYYNVEIICKKKGFYIIRAVYS